VASELDSHRAALDALATLLVDDIASACNLVARAIHDGHRVLLFGNGGSAADAQHIAAEFVGRFQSERRALPAIALTADASTLTAIANDYGYERVFERQIEALGSAGDIAIGISTSGNRPNVNRALVRARELGCVTLGLSGRGGGDMVDLCDLALVVPADRTCRIQEMHILIGHILCGAVDEALESGFE